SSSRRAGPAGPSTTRPLRGSSRDRETPGGGRLVVSGGRAHGSPVAAARSAWGSLRPPIPRAWGRSWETQGGAGVPGSRPPSPGSAYRWAVDQTYKGVAPGDPTVGGLLAPRRTSAATTARHEARPPDTTSRPPPAPPRFTRFMRVESGGIVRATLSPRRAPCPIARSTC